MHNSRNDISLINITHLILAFLCFLSLFLNLYRLSICSICGLQKYTLQTIDFAVLVTDKEHQRLSPWAHYFYVYGACPESGAGIWLEMSDYYDETKSDSMYAKIKVGLPYHFKVNNKGTKFRNIVSIEPLANAQNTGQSKQKKEVGFLGE